jgi:hypothetical protein
MRRVLRAVAFGALVVWLVRRLRGEARLGAEKLSVGYADGSSTILEVGSPERELILAAAADAL